MSKKAKRFRKEVKELRNSLMIWRREQDDLREAIQALRESVLAGLRQTQDKTVAATQKKWVDNEIKDLWNKFQEQDQRLDNLTQITGLDVLKSKPGDNPHNLPDFEGWLSQANPYPPDPQLEALLREEQIANNVDEDDDGEVPHGNPNQDLVGDS